MTNLHQHKNQSTLHAVPLQPFWICTTRDAKYTYKTTKNARALSTVTLRPEGSVDAIQSTMTQNDTHSGFQMCVESQPVHTDST